MEKRRVELLAPAGNKEAFYGAIHAGADAVYLGGSRFGARAYADNFTQEELIDCIRYAHIFGRKVYLTVNTLVKEEEFGEIYEYLAPFYAAGLDGVIVQDIGVFVYIREHFPDMELHVSTQMTITGKYGAGLLKEMGACRVVPARELNLDEISELKKETGLEVECFIHGAMCYCYSGQCLFSSILGGRSGNRGRCAQPCRLPYCVKEGKHTTKECYPLSLKDMCTIEMLPELIKAGIDSFKIEGRMKKPEYAAGVTAIYRKYIDRYYEAPEKEFRVAGEDLEKLSGLYIRSKRQDGYYHKHNGKDMVTMDSPAYSGSDEKLLAEIRSRFLEANPQFPVQISGCFKTGEKARVTFCYGELTVTAEGETVQAAERQPVSEENIIRQLCRLGGSVFTASDCEIFVSPNAFYPLKAMNELRREAVRQLETLLIQNHKLCAGRILTQQRKAPERINSVMPDDKKELPGEQDIREGMHVSVANMAQFEAVLQSANQEAVVRIDINGDLCVGRTKQAFINCLEQYADLLTHKELVLYTPAILRRRDYDYLQELLEFAQTNRIRGIRTGSLEGIGFLQKMQYRGKIYGDSSLYQWNLKTVAAWKQLAGICIPLELKSQEQRILLQAGVPCEKMFYGRIPMMVTANCVAKTTSGCRNGTGEADFILLDRYKKAFPVAVNCVHCMNIIYNTVPLSLHNELAKWKGKVSPRLDFTIESKREVLSVLDFFAGLVKGTNQVKNVKPPYEEYTTGHEKRGVE